jgi:ferredoxin
MKIKSLKIICFSPTGATRSIAQAVARGIGQKDVDLIDITAPSARKLKLQASEDELLVFAVPVHAGRVPALLSEWLRGIEGNNTPAVCVVVYGNRGYGDALLELRDIVVKSGCVPVACAAYIGEHSFSGPETPIAVSRPDADDLRHAESFGREIGEKMLRISSPGSVSNIIVPGEYPYKNSDPLPTTDFMEVGDGCSQCGICAQVCPAGAIDSENSALFDEGKCILCCACIKRCPQNARKMKPGMIKDIAIRLSGACKERKEPVLFL